MGDHWEQLLDLSVDEAGAEGRLQEVRNWLRANGWTKADPDACKVYFETRPADAFGPRSLPFAHNPGDCYAFVAKRDLYHAGDSAGGPVCPRCGTELPLMSVISRISDWDQGGTEPLLTCTECSWTALLGDWKVSSCMVVAHLAVIIDHTWSNLADPLIQALRTDLGGRWAYVHRHL